MKPQPHQDYGAACFYRRLLGNAPPFCSIQSRPSQYEINPEICANCSMPANPCKYLDAKVLIAPGLDGNPIPKVLYAKCRKKEVQKEVQIDEVTFMECRGCSEYAPNQYYGQDLDIKDSRVDKLTGLMRRERFDEDLGEMVLKAKASGVELTLILADIDHFKRINDTYGHLQGDNVLREVGKIAQGTVGQQGLACRYGGEEVALILPRLERKEAKATGEELRKTVELHCFKRIDKEEEVIPLTLSVGISLFPALAKDPVELIRQADQALYRAKDTGRNRVILYDPKEDTKEVPILLAVTFPGFPEISNSGKISLERWQLGERGIEEELVALEVVDHQRDVRTISEENRLGEEGVFTQPIEGIAREIVRQGNQTRFRLALRPQAYQELEKTIQRSRRKP